MSVVGERVGRTTREQLAARDLVLREPRRGFVQICADDGSRDGFPIGYAARVPSASGRGVAWQPVVRTVPGDDLTYYAGGLAQRARYSPLAEARTLDQAVDDIVGTAVWGDVLAIRERASGPGGGYTGTIDERQAAWLASLDEPAGITHLGGGRIRLTTVAAAYFRGSPRHTAHLDAQDRLRLAPMDAAVQLRRED